MPGWFAQVLDGGVVPSGVVAACSDFLALSLETRLHEAGTFELHLPRGLPAAAAFTEGRQIRLYRGTTVRAGGLIEKRVMTPASVQVTGHTQEDLLRRLIHPPDVIPLSESGTPTGSAYVVDWRRPAHTILEWLLREVSLFTWTKERWGDGTPTGASVDANGDLTNTGGQTVTFETPEIDLAADGFLLDSLILDYTSGASGINSKTGQYKTSPTSGGGTYTAFPTSEEDSTSGEGGSPIGRTWGLYSKNGTITLSRYVRFKVSVTSTNSGALSFRLLQAVIRGRQLVAKGSNWLTDSPAVSFGEQHRNRLEGEVKRWGGLSLLQILHDLILPMGIEFEGRAVSSTPPVELHLYAVPGAAQAKFPTVGADDATFGSTAWSNPGNVTVSNDAYATVTRTTSGTSHYLKATGFGFSIPTGATIRGIIAKIERKASLAGAPGVSDARVRIVKGGTIGASDRAKAGKWPTADAVAAYGSSADLWGETWTPADINGSGFGLALAADITTLGGLSFTGSVDSIELEVWYGTGTGRGTDRRASVALVVGEHLAAEWAESTSDDLRTTTYLRSRVVPDTHWKQPFPGDRYIHAAYQIEDPSAVAQYGRIATVEQAQELDADNTALVDERKATLLATKDPGTDLEARVVQHPQIAALAPGDIVSVVVPEYGVLAPFRVHGITVETGGDRGEAWSLRLSAPRVTPFDPAIQPPGSDELHRRRAGRLRDVDAIDRYLQTLRRQPNPTTKPGESA